VWQAVTQYLSYYWVLNQERLSDPSIGGSWKVKRQSQSEDKHRHKYVERQERHLVLKWWVYGLCVTQSGCVHYWSHCRQSRKHWNPRVFWFDNDCSRPESNHFLSDNELCGSESVPAFRRLPLPKSSGSIDCEDEVRCLLRLSYERSHQRLQSGTTKYSNVCKSGVSRLKSCYLLRKLVAGMKFHKENSINSFLNTTFREFTSELSRKQMANRNLEFLLTI
jgi:hypothetical protein